MENKDKILDIAMNLNRIGNWAADSYPKKQKRIIQFLEQTSTYLSSIKEAELNNKFKKTYSQFKREFSELHRQGLTGPKDSIYWAEKVMTWGNILTHRSQLLD